MVKNSDPGFRHTWPHVSGIVSVKLWASHFFIQSLSFLIWKEIEHGVLDPHRARPFLSPHLKGHQLSFMEGVGKEPDKV